MAPAPTPASTPDDKLLGSVPAWAQITLVVLLISMSAMFSGLTLGLLGLDKIGLDIVIHGDNKQAAENAKKIKPVRDNGNLLLCTLLFGNVAVNAVLAIILGELVDVVVSIVLSTSVIVIFGEILPQALCNRYALQIGSFLIPLVKVLIVIFYIIAKPLALMLDLVLGEELGTVHSKKEIMRLLEIHVKHGAVDDAENLMVQGALSIQNVLLKSIMTPIDDVFMLPLDSRLDFDLLTRIFKSGFSRIPVFSKSPNHVVGLLVTKDLIFIDPEDAAPLDNFLQVFGRPIVRFDTEMKATHAFKIFKSGKAHMGLVQEVNDTGPGDPFYEIKGVVTIEDIIEEILQDEIVDETDVHIDVHDKTTVDRPADHGPRMDIARIRLFNPDYLDEERLLPEEASAISAHLRYNHLGPMDPRKNARAWLPKNALNWLLHEKATVRRIKRKAGKCQEPQSSDWLFIRGKKCPSMLVVITGQVTAWSGIEAIRSINGAFTVFGIDALLNDYIADVSICVTSETLRVLEITRECYEECVKMHENGFTFSAATQRDHYASQSVAFCGPDSPAFSERSDSQRRRSLAASLHKASFTNCF